jgi:predicted nucleic acid-binding protein
MTHAYVVVEASAVIQRRLGREALRAFHQEFAPVLAVVEVDAATRDAAVAALLAALPTKTSIVDYVSFQVMRDRGIRRAFAFDPDFMNAGFEIVPRYPVDH